MTTEPNPYNPPLAKPAAERAPVSANRKRQALARSVVSFAVAIATGAAAVALDGRGPRPLVTDGLFAAVICACVGAWFACAAIVRTLAARGPRAGGLVAGLLLFVANGMIALVGAFLALLLQSGGRGRQIRRLGRVLLPRLRAGAAWSHFPGVEKVDVDASVRERVAARWRENARTEHASVAAFARLTLELVALGAPPDLLAASQSDGLDEIRHARMCLALATAIDGRHESPAPFADALRGGRLPSGRKWALATLAVNSLVDGVLHEGTSARVLARVARLAEAPEIRRVLRQLAADEGRHAANGWHVVDWCVREGGDFVVRALRGAAYAIPETKPASALGPEDGSWQRWGIAGHALEAAEYENARRHLRGRLSELATARRGVTSKLGRNDFASASDMAL